MTTKIQYSTLAEQKDHIKVLWYGRGGSGKTTAALQLANIGPVLVINAEDGVKRNALTQRGVNTDNVRIYDGDLSYRALTDLAWEIRTDLMNDPDAWTGIVIDSVTEIQKILLDSIVEQAVEKADRKGMDREAAFIDRADYGVMTEQMRKIIRLYRDLPCSVGFTALERRDQDDDGLVERGPALTPALQNDLVGWVDMVIHTELRTTDEHADYIGITRPKGTYTAKDRMGVLPIAMVNPGFDRVLAYVEGAITLDTDQDRAEMKKRLARNTAKKIKTDTPQEDGTADNSK